MKLLLKNGKVYDGSKNPPIISDVLIEDDKIVQVANNIEAKDAKVLDCTGFSVSPGFIDSHSHNDFFCDREDSERFIKPFVEQGMTTQIVGNCGFSTYGVSEDSKYKELVGGGLFKGIKPGSLSEWKKDVKGKLLLNVVPLIGHGTNRISVSGYDAKPLDQEQIEKMVSLTERDMKDGAFGGSFGFMYEPGMYSKQDELVAFAKAIAKYDGILTVHTRANSNVSMGYPLLKPHHLELALDELMEIVEASKVRCEYSHLIFVGKKSWPRLNSMLKKIHDYVNKGYKLGFDLYSYTYGASVITVLLPAYFMALPKDQRHKGLIPLKTKFLLSITKAVLGLGFEDLKVAYISDTNHEYEGKTVAQIAKEEGASNVDTYLKLVEMSNGQGRLLLDNYYNDEIIKTLMQDDLSIFMTDAWVEEVGVQNGSTFSSFPQFFKLARQYNIPVQNVVNKMTQAIAERFFIPNRGTIKSGYFADITVFNEENIGPGQSEESRPHGIEYVITNGQVVLEKGKYNGLRAGKVLEKK